MLRLLAAVMATGLLAATAAHAAEDDRPGAGSAFDYEFRADASAGTVLTPQRTDSEECLLHAPYDEACVDGSACWINDPAAVQDPRKLDGAPRPKRDDHVAFMSCVTASGDQWSRWYWSSDRDSVTD